MTMTAQAIDNIGFVAAFCTTVAFVPQLLRVIGLRSARDISLGTFLLFSDGVSLWLLYASNAATLGLSPSILYLKMRTIERP
jgi:MtN3 and saliva related transmembrane protein